MASLLLIRANVAMFRIAALSIALTVTAGQDPALWCDLWCAPPAAAASVCHEHQGESSPSLTLADHHDCEQMAASVGTSLREEGGRAVAAAYATDTIQRSRDSFAQLTLDGRPEQEPGREWWLDTRPLRLPLRI